MKPLLHDAARSLYFAVSDKAVLRGDGHNDMECSAGTGRGRDGPGNWRLHGAIVGPVGPTPRHGGSAASRGGAARRGAFAEARGQRAAHDVSRLSHRPARQATGGSLQRQSHRHHPRRRQRRSHPRRRSTDVLLSAVGRGSTPKERDEILKQALEVLIDREVLLQDALGKLEKGGKQGEKFIQQLKKVADEEFEKRWLKPLMEHNHIESRDEFADFMQRGGLSLEVMRRWWQRNFMAMEYLRSRIEPQLNRIGHTEIAEYYTSHREEYTQPDSVHWQDILINAAAHASRDAARQFAESLVRRVHQGEDFVKLSAEFDNGTSGRFRKGDGEGRKHGEIFPREAEPILFQMKQDDMEIVETKPGFHIVRLVKGEYAGPIPFDSKVQKEIRDKLRNAVFQREMKSITTELKRKAIIDPPVR